MGDALPPPAAYVRLRGLSPRAVGRIKWWRRVGRELKSVLLTDPAAVAPALRGVRLGFYPSSAPLYEADRVRAGDYVSDRQKELSWAINWPAAGLLDDKLAFFFMMRHFEVPTPDVLAVVVGGRALPVGDAPAGRGTELVRSLLGHHPRLVVRPTRGAQGRGLWIVEAAEACRINGEAVTWAELEARLRALDDHVVTEWVEQAPYAREIFPGTTNTMRLLTMRSPGEDPFIATAVHRFGVPESVPADNWSRGGLSVRIDVATGTLGTGVTRPQNGRLEYHERHPTTGRAIAGVRVPGWSEVRESILDAARRMAFLPYVGWDVLVTEGGHVVIEGNKYTDVNLLQVHGPLQADPRIRAFYAAHGVR
jgi:hypothetical protein